MATVTAGQNSSGAPTINLHNAQGEKVEVPVEFNTGKSTDVQLFGKIVADSRFSTWAQSYVPRPQQRLELQKVVIMNVEAEKDDLGYLRIRADIVRNPERTIFSQCFALAGSTAAVLIVLRVNPEGIEGPPRRNEDGTPIGPRPREYVLFVKQTRAAVGAAEHREILNGNFGTDGCLMGSAASMITSECGLKFYESQMEDLTSLALSARREPARSRGVALAPETMDERVRLYLYRETVTPDFVESIQKKRQDVGSTALDLWSLNDAWRMTTDAKTLSALFLFHELKYHGFMPRYRAPREVKRAPVYTKIAELNPNQTGRNLQVKVVEPLKMMARGGRTGQRGLVVVGDDTGVVTLALEPEQISSVATYNEAGAALYLRNIQFDMSDGHMLVVLDSFGKVAAPTQQELSTFGFTVNLANDMSSTEYEKIVPEDEERVQQPPMTQRVGFRGGRGGGRPRAFRGRGRGRGGFF